MLSFLITFLGAFGGFCVAEFFLRWWDSRPNKMK